MVGPEDLPKVARWLGRQVKNLRRLVQEVKSELSLNDLEKEIEDTQKNIDQEIKHLKPEFDLSSEVDLVSDKIKASTQEIDQALNK